MTSARISAWRVLQLRKHGAPQEPRRARNQIFLKHPITSETKDRC